MDRTQMDFLIELMEVSFVLVETALYLNTHPNDEKALRLHNNASQRYSELEAMYEAKYGPLRNTGMSRYPWGYIDGPWPWEINFTNF
ncbi:spore coat protein CotJB [Tissierella sp. P1]|jgi:spore coat protein JB|uniref:spore coat protein CotJB n=1 Tax=Tissierella TaxID=41273 RepID=UPI000BA188D6|nr:spore coat protein CotJB [Tissierella sp. P1]OZV11677.1 spore coat protein CotJB [Tissierella sp. P1]